MFDNLTKNGRIEAMDLLRLIAAFFVILSHSMVRYVTNADQTPLFNFLWLTQIPLFMFTSGFTGGRKDRVDSFSELGFVLLRNCLVLLVPCFSFLLLKSLFRGSNFFVMTKDFILDPENGLWYLWVLFFIHVLFDIGLHLSNFIKSKISVIFPLFLPFICVLVIGLLFLLGDGLDLKIFGLKQFAYYVPFFCFGYIFRLCCNKFSDSVIFKKVAMILFPISLIILIMECFAFASIASFSDFEILFVAMRMVGSFSAIYVFVVIVALLTRTKLFCAVSKLGTFSLEAYYLHILLLSFSTLSSTNPRVQWLLAFAVAITLVISIVAILGMLYLIPFGHLLLFGTSFSIYPSSKRTPKLVRR